VYGKSGSWVAFYLYMYDMVAMIRVVFLAITCPPLFSPANGEVLLTNGLNYLSRALYMCSSGATHKNGSLNRTCGTNRVWSGSEPVCKLST